MGFMSIGQGQRAISNIIRDGRERDRMVTPEPLGMGFKDDPGFGQEADPVVMTPRVPTREGMTPAQLAGAAAATSPSPSAVRPREPDRSFSDVGGREGLSRLIQDSERSVQQNRQRVVMLREQARRAQSRGDTDTATRLMGEMDSLRNESARLSQDLVRYRRAAGGRTTAFQSEAERAAARERLQQQFVDSRRTAIEGAQVRLGEALAGEQMMEQQRELDAARMYASRITTLSGAEENIPDATKLTLYRNARALNDPLVQAIDAQMQRVDQGRRQQQAARGVGEARGAVDQAARIPDRLELDPIDEQSIERSQQRDIEAVEATRGDLRRRQESEARRQELARLSEQMPIQAANTQLAEMRVAEAAARAQQQGLDFQSSPEYVEAVKDRELAKIGAEVAGFRTEAAVNELNRVQSERQLEQVLGNAAPPATQDEANALMTRIPEQFARVANPQVYAPGSRVRGEVAQNLAGLAANVNSIGKLPKDQRKQISRELFQIISQGGENGQYVRPENVDKIPLKTIMAVSAKAAWQSLGGVAGAFNALLEGRSPDPASNVQSAVGAARETQRIRAAYASLYDQIEEWANE